MAGNEGFGSEKRRDGGPFSSNVKSRPQYERFGETLRYLTQSEMQTFFDCIEDYRHKLMFRMMYELGCRVGEFTRIQLRHLDFGRSVVLFPAENTKTGRRRTSYLPRGLMNEIVSVLRQSGRMDKRSLRIRNPDLFLFSPGWRTRSPYTPNRIRQIFRGYALQAGLNHEYGQDSRGRRLYRLTPHSLRHAHISHYIHVHKLPLPIVQRQVGHKSLRSTSVYLNPTDEAVAEAYSGIQGKPQELSRGSYARNR